MTYVDLPKDIEIPDKGESPFEKDMTLVAIVGIEDPLRKEVPGELSLQCKLIES